MLDEQGSGILLEWGFRKSAAQVFVQNIKFLDVKIR
jgi:hypothetical protein